MIPLTDALSLFAVPSVGEWLIVALVVCALLRVLAHNF